MGLQPFQPDVLKHVVTRIETTHRIQIDPVASIVLNARLVSVSGQVTAIVYQDRDADFTWDAATATAASEEDLIAFAVDTGTSDQQSPLAPPTHFDYGVFVKAEGEADAVALLELTYVHRVDYDRSFEPIQVSTWENPLPPLADLYGLPDVPEWEEDDSEPGEPPPPPPPPPDDGDFTFTEAGTVGGMGESARGSGDNAIRLTGSGAQVLEGASATMGISLSDRPLSDITVGAYVDSSWLHDITIDTTTGIELTFTTSNWDTEQFISVTAIEDSDVESPEEALFFLKCMVGDNILYGPNITTPLVGSLNILDNDADALTPSYLRGGPGITVDFDSVVISEDVAENFFDLRTTLRSQPSGDVTVTVLTGSLSDRIEIASGGAYASELELTFTAANWDTPQTLSVRALDDAIQNSTNPDRGVITLYVSDSDDPDYASRAWDRFHITALVYDNEAYSFARGIFILETEGRDDDLLVPMITTEGGTALLRLE